MRGKTLVGIAAAIFAAFAWSLNFVAPYILGPYSIYDLAVCRFLLSGVLGLAILYYLRRTTPRFTCRDWLVACWLGFVGYVGYFLAIMAAVLFAGPIVPPAFVALVPVVLAIVSNLGNSARPWRSLIIPITLTGLGLLLVNANAFAQAASLSGHQMVGVGLSVATICLWTHFAMVNRSALSKRPHINAWKWTAALMVASSVEMLGFIPFGVFFKLLNIPQVGIQPTIFIPVLLAALTLTMLGSLTGSWAWTVASKRLPIGLAGQLIVTETIFATSFGLIAHQQWPTWKETCGVTLLVVGVISAIGVFYRNQPAETENDHTGH